MNPFSIDPLDDDDLLAESDSGCPEAPCGRAVPPWMRKDMRWRVFPLARGKAVTFPPDPYVSMADFVERDHTYGEGFRPPMVVIAPAGGGLTTFHRWVRKRLDLDQIPTVELDFSRVAQIADPVRQQARVLAMWLGSSHDESAIPYNFPEVLDNLLLNGKLEKCKKNENHLRTYIMLRVEQVHPQTKEILLGRLRDLVETKAPSNVRFIVLAHETAPLEQSEPFSSFLSVCEIYRLADFSAFDIEAMWDGWGPEGAANPRDVADQCIAWTGGQPLLANLFLGRLFELLRTEAVLKADTFSRIGEWLEQHPPPGVAQHWQGELARLVNESSLLRRKVRNYVSGEVRETVTRDELPLFLAGWIGQDEEGRWAVRSRLHAQWAVDPLLAPERYLRSKGGER